MHEIRWFDQCVETTWRIVSLDGFGCLWWHEVDGLVVKRGRKARGTDAVGIKGRVSMCGNKDFFFVWESSGLCIQTELKTCVALLTAAPNLGQDDMTRMQTRLQGEKVCFAEYLASYCFH